MDIDLPPLPVRGPIADLFESSVASRWHDQDIDLLLDPEDRGEPELVRKYPFPLF